jgi:hypothetical protein
VARRTGRLFLNQLRASAILLTAIAGLWVFWSQFVDLARLSLWYDSTNVLLAAPSNPDYDLTTLPWQQVHPRLFEIRDGALSLTTSAEPYGYQAYATIRTNGANTAGVKFEADVEAGGVTIGLVQAGDWIAVNSSQHTGPFSELNSALLGFRRSLMVMIANRNPAGESRVTIKSLRLYLRK